MAEATAELKELGDKLAGLTLKQAVDLADYLKDTHGIEPAAGGAVMMAGPAAAVRLPRLPTRGGARRTSTSSSRPAATRRSRSSRSSARPPAWA